MMSAIEGTMEKWEDTAPRTFLFAFLRYATLLRQHR